MSEWWRWIWRDGGGQGGIYIRADADMGGGGGVHSGGGDLRHCGAVHTLGGPCKNSSIFNFQLHNVCIPGVCISGLCIAVSRASEREMTGDGDQSLTIVGVL